MNIKSMLLLFFLFSCVNKPTENELLDLDNSVGFINLNDFITRIELFPPGLDVTDSTSFGVVNWAIQQSEFRFKIEPIYDRIDTTGLDINGNPILDTVYSIHRTYNVFLENKKEVTFSGVDSISMNFTVNVENTNSYYDNINPLSPNLSLVEYLPIGLSNEYQTLRNLNQLLNTDIRFRIRLRFSLTTGYNLIGSIFEHNAPTYRVKFELKGFFRQ